MNRVNTTLGVAQTNRSVATPQKDNKAQMSGRDIAVMAGVGAAALGSVALIAHTVNKHGLMATLKGAFVGEASYLAKAAGTAAYNGAASVGTAAYNGAASVGTSAYSLASKAVSTVTSPFAKVWSTVSGDASKVAAQAAKQAAADKNYLGLQGMVRYLSQGYLGKVS